MKVDLKKGEKLEELLRNYFLKAGYYVVRGVPFSYEGFDVTDIDLWLYGRTSSVSRELAIVDIKNKRTPAAIERIFWVKGLQSAVNATNAIVATTDRRDEVKKFGKENGVMVLGGEFVSRISSSNGILKTRLSEEEVLAEIEKNTLGKLDGNWKGRLDECKSLLVHGLTFDSTNKWLDHGKYFAEQALTKPPHKELCLRACYLIASYIAVSIDYLLRELSFDSEENKRLKLDNGFRYGDRGSIGTGDILEASLALVEQFAENGTSVSSQVRSKVNSELSLLQTSILSEYFSKPEVAKSLFAAARELEAFAMNRSFQNHKAASVEARGIIGCLQDFWEISRVEFLK